MKKRKMLFIYNPIAGKEQIKNKLSEIIRIFCSAGFMVTIVATERKPDAYDLVTQYGEEYEFIVASGGDGTMNELAAGLMNIKNKPKCGYIPAGTVNDFASSLGIPKNMVYAAEMIVEEKFFKCDIGSFNNQYFTYVAGFGAFTEVSYQTEQELKNVLGKFAYFIEGVKHVSDIKPHHMIIEHDGKVIDDNFILGLISNSESVAGYRAYKKKNIKMDDGLFEIFLIRELNGALEVQDVLNALLSKELDSENIIRFKSSNIHITSDNEIAWTLDGEDGGKCKEVTMMNNRHAIEIACKRDNIE